jgi:hypothetical protein
LSSEEKIGVFDVGAGVEAEVAAAERFSAMMSAAEGAESSFSHSSGTRFLFFFFFDFSTDIIISSIEKLSVSVAVRDFFCAGALIPYIAVKLSLSLDSRASSASRDSSAGIGTSELDTALEGATESEKRLSKREVGALEVVVEEEEDEELEEGAFSSSAEDEFLDRFLERPGKRPSSSSLSTFAPTL